MRYLVMLGIVLWANTASAVPLTDIVAAGSFSTSGGLTFSNFQATLSYNIPPPPTVEGIVSTRQATLADLQLTVLPDGFQLTGFAWDGTVVRSTSGRFGEAPFSMDLGLNYTVRGLGGENSFNGPRVLAFTSSNGGFTVTSLTATTPIGQQVSLITCPATICTSPFAFLPLGTTEATVREGATITPFSTCGVFGCLPLPSGPILSAVHPSKPHRSPNHQPGSSLPLACSHYCYVESNWCHNDVIRG